MSCNCASLSSTKSMIIDIPSPARRAYMKSDKAAPMPVYSPDLLPLLRVRCMHSMPIGPIGADTNMPMARPWIIVSSVFIFALQR